MSGPREQRREVARWVQKAEHDLRAAEHAMELAEEGLTDIITFHCQQGAEKYLKALLVHRGISFPRTHDLRLLFDLVSTKVSLNLQREHVVPLNRYAIESRYPGDWDPITVADAQEALEMAQAVRRAALEHLPDRLA